MPRQIVHYNPNLKELAKRLRKKATLAEVLLWSELKSKKMQGYDFHRQKPIGNFIVDFFCSELRLIIEIDGESHENKGEKDRKRENQLESLGFYILRFDEREVRDQLEDVLFAIKNWINTPRRYAPPLSRGD